MIKGVSNARLLYFGLPVFGLLLGLVGYFVLVAPQKSEAGRLASQVTAAAAGLAVAPKPKSTAENPHAADIFRLSKAMPDAPDMPGILLQLSRLAYASHLTIESVKPATPTVLPAGYTALPMTVVFTGKFPAVSAFLGRMRQQASVSASGSLLVSGRMLLANQVALTTTDGKSVSATVNLDAFVYGSPPPPVPTAAGTAAATTGSTG